MSDNIVPFVDSLWRQLNDPDRLRPDRAAQSTYDAVLWSLSHNHGWYDRLVRERLAQFSNQQLNDLIAALMRKRVNPFVVAAIQALRHERRV